MVTNRLSGRKRESGLNVLQNGDDLRDVGRHQASLEWKGEGLTG